MEYNLEKEIYRKTMHLAVGATFAALTYFEIMRWWHFLIILIISLSFSFYIKYFKKNIPLISDLLNLFGREKEFPGLGAITFIIGTIIVTLLFSKEIATASILILAIGDAISPIIGKSIGRTKTILSKTKMFEGFIVGFLLSFIAIIPIVGWKIGLIGSSISLILEFWDETNFIDDNILIPLVAGTIMFIAQIYI